MAGVVVGGSSHDANFLDEGGGLILLWALRVSATNVYKIFYGLYFGLITDPHTNTHTLPHILRWVCVRDICVQFLVKLFCTPNGRPETNRKKSLEPANTQNSMPFEIFRGPWDAFVYIWSVCVCVANFRANSPGSPQIPATHAHGQKVASADLKLLRKTNQHFVGLKLCGIILVDPKSLCYDCCCKYFYCLPERPENDRI